MCARLQVADADQRQQLAEVIKRSIASVRRTSFGKNFHSKLAEKHPELFGELGIHVRHLPVRNLPVPFKTMCIC